MVLVAGYSSSARSVRIRFGSGSPAASASVPGLQRGELLTEVALQAAAVLALERAKVLDLGAELVALALQLAEQLGATLGGLGVQHGGPGACVGLDPLGGLLGLGGDPVRIRLRGADDPVGLALGLVLELFGVARRDLEQSSGGAGRVGHGGDLDGLGRRRGRRYGLRLRLRLRLGLGLGSGSGIGAGSAIANAHALLGGLETLAQIVVLAVEARELLLHLVEEHVDLAHVVALAQAHRSKALLAHVLWRQRHGVTLASRRCSSSWLFADTIVRGSRTSQDRLNHTAVVTGVSAESRETAAS